MENEKKSFKEDFIEENNDLKKNINEKNEYSIEEFEPSNTILENTIQKSIKENFKEFDFENNSISPEKFSQIINNFNDEKLSSTLINFDENIEYLEKKILIIYIQKKNLKI